MTYTVSISDLRNNITNYVSLLKQGDVITLTDKKRGITIGDLVLKKKGNAKEIIETLKKIKPLSAKRHPEWATKESISAWLRKSRMADERTFNDPPGL